jgi:V8-like Glu-specific endopeptidase
MIPLPEIADSTRFPFVCLIRSFFANTPPGKTEIGSGTLIGPRVILTAGHVVYDHFKGNATSGRYALRIEVTFGNGVTRKGVKAQTTNEWIQVDSKLRLETSAVDFGIIVLADPIDNQITPLRVETATRTQLSSEVLNVAGYPAGPPGGAPSYPLFGKRTNVTMLEGVEHRLFYPVHTLPGMSGGPIYKVDSSPNSLARTVMGVHTSLINAPNSVVNGFGSALRITEGVHDLINVWLNENRPGA